MAEPISLNETILRAEQNRINNIIAKTSGWLPTFLDGDGPSFTQPSTNFPQAVGLRVRRGALQLGEASYIPGIGSVAEMIARAGVDSSDDNLPPFQMTEGRIVLENGVTVDPEEATGSQLYDSLDPIVKQILLQNGYTKDNFADADYDKFRERYNNASHFIRVNDRLDAYEKARPGLYWTAGAAAFGSNVLTDPLTYLSLGTARGLKAVGTGLAKEAAKETVESKVKQTVIRLAADMKVNNLDIGQALVRLGTDGNKVAAYSLYAGIGGSLGATQDALSQYFEYEERLDQGFKESFNYDPMRGAFSTLLGAAFASWGGLHLNKAVTVPTNKAVAALSDTTLTGNVVRSLLRRGSIQEDAIADLKSISGWDRIQAYLDGVYDEEDAAIIQLYLDDWTNAPSERFIQEPVAGIEYVDMSVDSRGKGVQYHGATSEIKGLSEGYYMDTNIYGGANTFYTTDALDIASGYHRKSKTGVTYRVEEKTNVKFFDMEKALSAKEVETLIPKDDIVADAMSSLRESGVSSPNLRQIMDEIRNLSRDYGFSTVEITDLFSAITYNLKEQGFGGMQHIGGLKTGRQQHTVKIYLDPANQISLKRVEDVSTIPTRVEPIFRRSEEDVREFMLTVPTPNELIKFIGGEDVKTAVGASMSELSDLNAKIRDLKSKGIGGKELEQAEIARTKILEDLEQASQSFRFKKTPTKKTTTSVLPEAPKNAKPYKAIGYRGAKDGQQTLGNAEFFSPDRKVAEAYAGPDGVVTQQDIDFKQALVADNWVDARLAVGLKKTNSMQDLIDRAVSLGYDGIVFAKHRNGPEFVRLKTETTTRTSVSLSEEAQKASAAVQTIMQSVEPLTIYMDQKQRLALMDGLIARNAVEATDGQMTTQQRGLIRKYLFDKTDFFGGAFTPGGVSRSLTKKGNWMDLLIAQMISAVDMHGSDTYIAREFGEAVPSLHWRTMMDSADRRKASAEARVILNKYRKNANLKASVERDAMRIASGDTVPSASEDSKALAEIIRGFFDRRGSRGVQAGALKDLLTNYVHIRLVKHPSEMDGGNLITKLGRLYSNYLYTKHYSGENLHLGTLADMGLISKDGKPLQGLDSIPTKRSQLTPEQLVDYNTRLNRQLEIEAEYSFRKRLNRRSSDKYDPAVTGDDTPYIYREQSAAARKIEQEFYLSDEVAELGIVDYDILNNMRAYDNSFGSKIRTTELLKEIYGVPTRWEDMMDVLRRRVESNSSHENYEIRKRGLQRLEAAYDMATHRGYRTDSDPIAGLNDMAVSLRAATTNGRVVLSMAPEQFGLLARAIFKPAEIVTLVRDMATMFGKLRKADIEDFALTHMYEDEVSRFFGDALDSYKAESGALGDTVVGFRQFSNGIRKIFLEQYVTEQNRRVAFNMVFSNAYRKIIKNPDRAALLGADFADAKAFKKAAREAGFAGEADTARLLRMAGIARPEVVEGLKLLKQKAKGRNPRAVLSAIAEETDPVARQQMESAYNAVFRYSRQKVDEIIVTPTPATRLDLTKTPEFLRPHIQFLSYRVAWFNSFLFRAGSEPIGLGLGLIGAAALGEAMNMVSYDILYGGTSPEDVVKEWEDNPMGKTAEAVARVPIGGAYSDVWGLALDAMTGNRSVQPSAIPSRSMISNFMSTGGSNIRKMIDGDLSATEMTQDLSRYNPLQGWYLQIFLRGLQGFENTE
jgi:hypothetical protein